MALAPAPLETPSSCGEPHTHLLCHPAQVLVVGPEASGKASLCRILANYAARMHHHPLLVNADPSKVRLIRTHTHTHTTARSRLVAAHHPFPFAPLLLAMQGLLGIPGAVTVSPIVLPGDPAHGFIEVTPLVREARARALRVVPPTAHLHFFPLVHCVRCTTMAIFARRRAKACTRLSSPGLLPRSRPSLQRMSAPEPAAPSSARPSCQWPASLSCGPFLTVRCCRWCLLFNGGGGRYFNGADLFLLAPPALFPRAVGNVIIVMDQERLLNEVKQAIAKADVRK